MLEFVIPGIRHPLFSEFLKKKRTEKLQKSTNEKKKRSQRKSAEKKSGRKPAKNVQKYVKYTHHKIFIFHVSSSSNLSTHLTSF